MKKLSLIIVFILFITGSVFSQRYIEAYVVWDNTVMGCEVVEEDGIVYKAAKELNNQFSWAYFDVRYGESFPEWQDTPDGKKSNGEYSVAVLLCDLQDKFSSKQPLFHTIIGVSTKPVEADYGGNGGMHNDDYAFIDYDPIGCSVTDKVSVVLHEWGHSLGSPGNHCSNNTCVNNTEGCKNGSRTFCAGCSYEIKEKMLSKPEDNVTSGKGSDFKGELGDFGTGWKYVKVYGGDDEIYVRLIGINRYNEALFEVYYSNDYEVELLEKGEIKTYGDIKLHCINNVKNWNNSGKDYTEVHIWYYEEPTNYPPPSSNFYDAGTEYNDYIGDIGDPGWNWVKVSDQGETIYVRLVDLEISKQAQFEINYKGQNSYEYLNEEESCVYGSMKVDYVNGFYGIYGTRATEVHIYYAGLNKGVTEYKKITKIPNEFILSPNYPNPFNPTTTINYSLPEEVNVNISVYNINGKLVQTLLNEYKEAGNYNVVWDANNVSSGVYFYRITAGNFIETKRMLLVK